MPLTKGGHKGVMQHADPYEKDFIFTVVTSGQYPLITKKLPIEYLRLISPFNFAAKISTYTNMQQGDSSNITYWKSDTVNDSAQTNLKPATEDLMVPGNIHEHA